MFLILAGVMIGGWVLASGWKFYKTIDWEEPADPSPDLRTMHKKEAELVHIQGLLAEACAQGKLSQKSVDEFSRYSQAEIEEMRKVETAWKRRREKK